MDNGKTFEIQRYKKVKEGESNLKNKVFTHQKNAIFVPFNE